MCPALRLYKGGIFDDPDCAAYGSNHAVLLIGWGKEDDVEYWIVKNSMGTEWGENGFARIKIGSGDTNLLKTAHYAPIFLSTDEETPTSQQVEEEL